MIPHRRHAVPPAAPVEKDESEVRWLISYSDFMMQLVCLFIVLYTVGTIAPESLGVIAASVRASAGLDRGPRPEAPVEPASAVGEGRPLLVGDLRGGELPPELAVRIEPVPGGWTLAFRRALFNGGSAILTEEGKSALDSAAAFLSLYAGSTVVGGTTDGSPEDALGGDPAGLASARAAAAVSHLTRSGFPKALDPRFVRAVGLTDRGESTRGASIRMRVD